MNESELRERYCFKIGGLVENITVMVILSQMDFEFNFQKRNDFRIKCCMIIIGKSRTLSQRMMALLVGNQKREYEEEIRMFSEGMGRWFMEFHCISVFSE